jgi:hypothetical protein
MNLELLFSVVGILSMVGWLTLLASPFFPHWSDKIAGFIIPVILSVGYVTLIVFLTSDGGGGGFGSLAEVVELFSHQNAVIAGWVHFLAFDLLVGAWICRTARREGVNFWLVVPCLPLTFLFGPAGFMAFSLLRNWRKIPE